MVYPGIGWVIYRDISCLPDDMVRVVNIWIVSVDSAPHDGVLFFLIIRLSCEECFCPGSDHQLSGKA